MFCPECGSDAADAKFCPECGTDLGVIKQARGGAKSRGNGGGPAADKPGRLLPREEQAPVKRPGQLAPRKPAAGGSGTPPWVIWVVIAAILVPVALIVGLGGSKKDTTGNGGASSGDLSTSTKGSYEELVVRANALFDAAAAALDKGDYQTMMPYATDAAKVYEAAWKKQPGDPSVGTDWSIMLFYSQQVEAALRQVDVVLGKNPDFQLAWLNKGIFLNHQAAIAKDAGKASQAKESWAQARAAWDKTIALGADTDAGKQAADLISKLPK